MFSAFELLYWISTRHMSVPHVRGPEPTVWMCHKHVRVQVLAGSVGIFRVGLEVRNPNFPHRYSR